MSPFVVESSRGDVRLEFHGVVPRRGGPYEGFEIKVRLSGAGLNAGERVYDHLPQRWSELFRSLADDWRGWEGERTVESLEHQLRLSCTINRTGQVFIRVALRGDLSGSDWQVQQTLDLESHHLDDLARRAEEYFG